MIRWRWEPRSDGGKGVCVGWGARRGAVRRIVHAGAPLRVHRDGRERGRVEGDVSTVSSEEARCAAGIKRSALGTTQ